MKTLTELHQLISNSQFALLRYADDWSLANTYIDNDAMVYSMYSPTMEAELYIVDKSYDIEITDIKPGMKWSFEILPESDWTGEYEVAFKVMNDTEQFDGFISHYVKLPLGSKEVKPGIFSNANYTPYNLREMMALCNVRDASPIVEHD